ncbi:hypothetical protein [Orenia marismortui]|uniref:Uncharacterized protein n=1 Tax=Orenia marismortui TaxID=46469 RepID=A0A4R8GD41_9FIRM|nr:hypothetical protein [Orenia marismortui]TDX43025.1 hypothetical protein C7959_1694 [Orenia marismortui]
MNKFLIFLNKLLFHFFLVPGIIFLVFLRKSYNGSWSWLFIVNLIVPIVHIIITFIIKVDNNKRKKYIYFFDLIIFFTILMIILGLKINVLISYSLIVVIMILAEKGMKVFE